MEPRHAERVALSATEKFSSPEDELAYLRERVREKEQELDVAHTKLEGERLARKEIVAYGEAPAARILHEAYAMPEHEILHTVLQLEPEEHDAKLDELLKIIAERGIRNALAIAARMRDPHLEDDVHRMLVRYLAEGLPYKGAPPPERVRRALGLALYEVRPEGAHADDEDKQKKLGEVLASSEQLYAGLLSLVGDAGTFSLEIAVPDGAEHAVLFIAIPGDKKQAFEQMVSSIFPNASLSEARGDYNIFCPDGVHVGAEARLSAHPAFSLKTYDVFEHDPLNVVLSAFGRLAKYGEGAALQIVVGNAGERYNAHYKKILREVEKGKPVEEALKTPETAFGDFIHELAETVFRNKKELEQKRDREANTSPDKTASEAIERKIRTRIAPATLRLVASARSKERAAELLSSVAATMNQFDNATGNRFVFEPVSRWGLSSFLHGFTYREPGGNMLPLSLAEITTLFHVTAERVTTSRELKATHAKQSPAPIGMTQEGILLGVNRYGAARTEVRFAPQDRLRHCYIVGQTGTGKTGLIKNMIIQDIQNGEGVGFIDPHGTDIEDILAAVPPEREKDIVYFDPAYTERPMGLNMLEYDRARPELKTFVVDEVYAIFRKLYADVPEAFGPMFEQYYRNATLLVVDDPESGNTLVEIPRVLADGAFRRLKLSRCTNPLVVQFWETIAERAGGDASLENVVPYITSKIDVFLANDIMRPIVAQDRSAFDFRALMDGKKIFLANLSKGRLGERNMSLLGLILVSKFLQAAFSRVDGAGGAPPFYLYIDEFQNFATPSVATILSEARKYKLALTVAHQFIAQLEDDIRDAVIGNVGTKAAFRVGASDAEFLAKQFAPIFGASDLENLPNRTAVASLLVGGAPARPFTFETVDLPFIDRSRLAPLKELSYGAYGRDRAEVEAEIAKKFGTMRKPSL